MDFDAIALPTPPYTPAPEAMPDAARPLHSPLPGEKRLDKLVYENVNII